jgi:hypothetical protein
MALVVQNDMEYRGAFRLSRAPVPLALQEALIALLEAVEAK